MTTNKVVNMNVSRVKHFKCLLDDFQISDYHGLKNLGATCYLNCVLQVLFMTKEFREAVRWCGQGSSTIDPHLARLFDDLQRKTSDTLCITKTLGIAEICEQHDAAEYLERILNMTSPEASKVFKGLLRHRATCTECQQQNDEEWPFWNLPLSMEDRSDQIYSVLNGYKAFFRPTMVSGDNQLYCEECKGKTDATIECDMEHHPEVLVLLLKRFKFDSHTMCYVKNDCCVEMPLRLQTENGVYVLYAFVNHFGSLKGGHLTATIKSYETGHWYNFDDARVNLVKLPLCEGGDATRSSSAYLLMYRKALGGELKDKATEEEGEAKSRRDHYLRDESVSATISHKFTKSRDSYDATKVKKMHRRQSISGNQEERHPVGYDPGDRVMTWKNILPAGGSNGEENGLDLESKDYSVFTEVCFDDHTEIKALLRKPQEATAAEPEHKVKCSEHHTDYQGDASLVQFNRETRVHSDILFHSRDIKVEENPHSHVNMVKLRGTPTTTGIRLHEDAAENRKTDPPVTYMSRDNDDRPPRHGLKSTRGAEVEARKKEDNFGRMVDDDHKPYVPTSVVPGLKGKVSLDEPLLPTKPMNPRRDGRNVGMAKKQGKGKLAQQNADVKIKPWR